MRRFAYLLSITALSLMVLTGNALADKQVLKTVQIPVDFTATIQTSNCSALPGPQVMVQSQIVASGLQTEFIFSQQGQQSGERFVVEQALVPQNAAIPVPQQAVVAGIGGNPFMWLQLVDGKGKPLSGEIFLGQCSQGLFNPTAVLTVPVETSLDLSASNCDNAPGPIVSVNDGAAVVSAINGRLILRSTSDPRGHVGEVISDLIMLPAGQIYNFPPQQVQGQISAQPQISLQFREGGGAAIGTEVQLGRCVALSN